MAPIPIGLPVSLVEPVKIVVFAMSLPEPQPIGLILVVIPDMLVMMSGILITTIVLSFSALLIPMVVLCHYRDWRQQCRTQNTDTVESR